MAKGQCYAPDEPRAKAIALREQGHSYASIGGLTGYPGRTVARWIKRAELAEETKPILDRWRRVTLQAQDIIRDGLDKIEEDETGLLAVKHLQTMNIIAGTGTDKLQKESTPQVQANTQVIIVLGSERPIEGEVIRGD